MSGTALAFAYVVDGPRLQAQALILAASLRRHHPGALQFAYCPKANFDALPPALVRAMEALGVTLVPLPQPEGTFAGPYPHGNKMRALALARKGARHSVFLDTDMVMRRALDLGDLPDKLEVSVVPEGIRGWGKDEDRWIRAYGFFGLQVPPERIKLLRGRRALSPPYFNGGFVAIHEEGKVAGKSFGAHWLATASAFDHEAPLGGKRPWLDQICLPLAMARFGYRYKLLDEVNNCSISNGRELTNLGEAKILHYHRSAFLRAWPEAEALIAAGHDAALPADRGTIETLLTEAGYLGPIQDTAPPRPEA